jgi:crossover junction endodeoxyribonuclease RusA
MTVSVRLPWPPSCLTPNAKRRKHWSVYRGPAKKYREACWALTLEAKAKGRLVSVTFYPPHRRFDDDSMIGAFKHGRDGIADALGVNDKHFRPSYIFADPVPGGLIEARIGEAA